MGNSGSSLDFIMPAEVPLDVWIELLLNVDDLTLRNCRLVNKTFHSILASQSFWLKRCIQHRVSYPKLHHSKPTQIDYRKIYFLKPYGRNLIKNPNGQDGTKNWTFLQHGGDGFRVENPPNGAGTIDSGSCFASSYAWCVKEQIIDLNKIGCDQSILDELQPTITVSEWTAGRFDCGSVYILRVFLLKNLAQDVTADFGFLHQIHNDDRIYWDDPDRDHVVRQNPENSPHDPRILGNIVLENTVNQWEGGTWKEISHEFTNYGPGVRYVVFQSCGKDLQFWKDWYGAKMTKASVIVKFSD